MHHFNRQPSNTPANANARLTGQPAARNQSAFVPTPSFQAVLNQADTLAHFQRLAAQVQPQMGALPSFGVQAPFQLGAARMGAFPNFGFQVPTQMGLLPNFRAPFPTQMGAPQIRALPNYGAQIPAQVGALPNLGAQVPPQMGAAPFGGVTPLPLAALAQWMTLQQASGLFGNRLMVPFMPTINISGVAPQVPAPHVPVVAPQVAAGQDPEGERMGANDVHDNSQTPSTIAASPSTRPTTSDSNLVQPGGIVQPTRNVPASGTSDIAPTTTGPSYSSYLEDYEFDSEEEEDKDEPCCSSSLRPYSDQPSTSAAQNSRKRVQEGGEDKDNCKKTKKSKKEEEPTKPDETEIKIEVDEEENETDPQVVHPRRDINEPTQAELERIDPEILWVCGASHCILHEILPRLPKNQDVHWVQCDNRKCNKWFHSVCVRMTNTKFKDTTAFFCCGKAQTQHGKNAMSGAIYRRWKNTLAREASSCRSEMLKEEEARKRK